MSEPRIAVDARPLCHPGTGIYRYTLELFKRVCNYGGEWFLYSPQAYDRSALQRPNIHHRSAGVPPGLRASQLGQVFFPIWARLDRVAVFWSPRHQLPLFLPSGIRGVVTIHDLVWKRYGSTMRFPGKQLDGYLMPKSLRRADVVVAVSDFTRRELHHYFPDLATDVRLIPGASYLSGTEGLAYPDGTRSERYFLFVGTMEPRKNLRLLLRAFKEYSQLCEDPLRLQIVGGSGWGGVDAHALLRELQLESSVNVAGRVTEQELGQLYAGAHALVMPSLYEGFGLPVAESLSMGVPVIASRDSAMSEVGGSAGLYVDPESVSDMAAALLRMTSDHAFYAILRQRASVEAARYDWDRSASAMANLLLQ